MTISIPVFICLRNKLVRDGLELILTSADYSVQSSIARSEDLQDCKIEPETRFILILDDPFSSGVDLDTLAQFKRSYPRMSIVVLLDTYPEGGRRDLERLGLAALLLKSISSEVFVASMKLVALGERVYSMPIAGDPQETATVLVERLEKVDHPVILLPEPSGDPVERPGLGTSLVRNGNGPSKLARRSELSERELHILTCLVAGNSNKVIARACGITEATVKVHLKAILRKTDVANRTQAAVWAMNNVGRTGAAMPMRMEQATRFEGAWDARTARESRDGDSRVAG